MVIVKAITLNLNRSSPEILIPLILLIPKLDKQFFGFFQKNMSHARIPEQ